MEDQPKRFVVNIGGANFVGLEEGEAVKKAEGITGALVSPISSDGNPAVREASKKFTDTLTEWDRAQRERSKTK